MSVKTAASLGREEDEYYHFELPKKCHSQFCFMQDKFLIIPSILMKSCPVSNPVKPIRRGNVLGIITKKYYTQATPSVKRRIKYYVS